ncbi:MAG TPA: GNAT family N-acetyltransferase [Methylocella sp.]|nr:GNAT family N-acetyltransferase [Methylocella sp.]
MAALDRFFREKATQNVKRLLESCFVAVELRARKIAGYDFFSEASILAKNLLPDVLNSLACYPVLPAASLRKLAADLGYSRKGVGSSLIANTALRVINSDAKALALISQPKDKNAAAFCKHHGFIRSETILYRFSAALSGQESSREI